MSPLSCCVKHLRPGFTFIPLLFCTTCHMWASTLLWGAGGCWGWRDGLRGVTAKAPTVLRLWSGAHTQFIITWDETGGGEEKLIPAVFNAYSSGRFVWRTNLQRRLLDLGVVDKHFALCDAQNDAHTCRRRHTQEQEEAGQEREGEDFY